MAAESGELLPTLTAIGRTEDACVLNAGKDRVGIAQRWFKVPYPCEFPRVRRAVVPLVSTGHALVLELVAHRLPGRSTIVRALDQLPEPSRGL